NQAGRVDRADLVERFLRYDHGAGGAIPVIHQVIRIVRVLEVVPTQAVIERQFAADLPRVAQMKTKLTSVAQASPQGIDPLRSCRHTQQKLSIGLTGYRPVKREVAVRPFGNHIVEIPEPPQLPAKLDHVAALQPRRSVAKRVDVDVLRDPAWLHAHLLYAGNGNRGETHRAIATGIHALQTDLLDDVVALHRGKSADGVPVKEVILDPAPAKRIDKAWREHVRVAHNDRVMVSRAGPGSHL